MSFYCHTCSRNVWQVLKILLKLSKTASPGWEMVAGWLTRCFTPQAHANARFIPWYIIKVNFMSQYQCNVINVYFSKADNFTTVSQRDTSRGPEPPLPFTCNICNISFTKRYFVRSHIMTVHEEMR